MTVLLLVLLYALLSLGLCLSALAQHRQHGLAPLLLVLALLESVKYFLAAYILVPLPGLGLTSLGSVVGYVNLLVVAQATYVRLGTEATRLLAFSVLGFSLGAGALSALIGWMLPLPGVVNLGVLGRDQLLTAGWVLLMGNLLMLAGLVASVVIAQSLLRRGWRLGVAMVTSLTLVMLVDTLVFLLLSRGPSALTLSMVLSHAEAKTVMGLLLGSLAAWWLRDGGLRDGPTALDLLRALSYRHRLETLERELQTDPLTGLFNRRYLERTVPDILRLDRQRGDHSALLLVDLDHFKALNDRHGHLAGDAALRHVASVLQQGVRHHDSVIRYGGEEFLVVLPSTTEAAARAVAGQLLERLAAQPATLPDGTNVVLGATIGGAMSPRDGPHWYALLARADARMYEGKRAGRGRVVF